MFKILQYINQSHRKIGKLNFIKWMLGLCCLCNLGLAQADSEILNLGSPKTAKTDSAQASLQPSLNNLKFTNRAQCALDSELPTDSAFMVIDGYNAGKLSYNLAKSVGLDTEATSTKGMKEFRVSVTSMATEIMNKVLAGSLPLLPLNLKNSKLYKYNGLVTLCSKKTYCPELNTYLAKLWENSEGAGVPWEKIDSFTGAHFSNLKKAQRVSCMYVKKFSPLQEHLHTTVINQVALTEMAQAFLDKDKYITSCDNMDDSLDSRNSIIQFDLKFDKNEDFKKLGFDFWNSVKIYLSFAWRYTDIASKVSPELGQLFKSIALEESLMMMPNGCKSIEMPSCDAETLSMNSLRELAKPDGFKAEPGKNIPEGPESSVIKNGPRSVNNDFLGTRGYKDASEWVSNFRKNFIQIRGSLKNRAQSSIQFMNVLSASMTGTELADYVRPLAFSKSYTNPHRDELYYLCTEARLAGDKRIDFMKSGIDKIKDMAVMQKVFEGSKKSLYEVTNYFDTATSAVLTMCDILEKQKIWSQGSYQVNRSGFSPWARELLNIPSAAGAVPEVQPISFGAPLLVWDSTRTNEEGNVICQSGLDCVRKLTKSMVDLYAVAKYAEAYLPVTSTVTTPDVFNPYAELKACKIYDPWFYTRRANKRLLSDLVNTALFGWNFVPIYVDIDFKPPHVTSLNQLIKNGIVKFDPKVEPEKMEASLLADLGPLVGAPCAISIAPNSGKIFNFYAFNGISLNYCNEKSAGTSVGESNGSVNNPTPKSHAYCGGCSINFIGVASGVAMTSSMTFNPIKLGIYLFRSVYRFMDAKSDNVNIPLAREVDLNKVAKVYKEYGGIPKKCMDSLALGDGCEL
jgi:hypothetical protein